MADVHIWEKGEIHCSAVGLAATVKAVKFNFYKGSEKVGSVDATLIPGANLALSQNRGTVGGSGRRGAVSEGSTPTTRGRSNAISGGSRTPSPPSRLALAGHRVTQAALAMYEAPECGPDDAFVKLSYKLEVDGTEKPGFIHDVYVWAKKIKIKSQKHEDGAKLPRAKLKITQQSPDDQTPKGTSVLERVTDDNGELEVDLVFPAEANIAWQRPYAFKSWVKGTASSGRERIAKLERGFIAKLIFPDPAADPELDPRPVADQSKKQHIQWVNIDPAQETLPPPEWGSKIKIRVGAVNPSTVVLNEDKVFLKAKWDSGNLERVVGGPLTKDQIDKGIVSADPEWPEKDKEYTEEKVITASNKEVVFELELGPTGGDKVVVEVGGTSDCKDAKVEIVNWRMLTYELLFPTCLTSLLNNTVVMPLEPLSEGLPNFVTGFQPETSRWADERLQKAFIAYYPRGSYEVDDDHADLGKAVVESAYVKPLKDSYGYNWEDGKKVFVPGSWVRRTGMWQAVHPRNNQVTLCHTALSSGRMPDNSGPLYEAVRGQTTNAGLVELELDITAALGKYSFKNAMGWHVERAAISEITWRAVINAGANPGHPGVSGTHQRRGNIAVNDTNVTRVDCTKIKVKVPDAPKAWIGAKDAQHCPIEIKVMICGAYLINGNAGGGQQLMVVARPKEAMAATICHELGHAMGLTPYPSGTWKVPPPRGLPNPDVIPTGLVYDSNFMHVGTHCAFSISATDRAKAKFDGKAGTCIMFGSGGDEVPPKRGDYCADCLKYLKARKLHDIRGRWDTRGPDDL